MTNYKNIIINQQYTIKQAMQAIDEGAKKFVLVMDDSNKLLGTLTDGDIRRGLLNNLSLSAVVKELINYDPIVFKQGSDNHLMIQRAKDNGIVEIPVVNKDGLLLGFEPIVTPQIVTVKSNKVVLMVGGMGTRLRPLTNDIPKPMLQVGDRPILQTIIESFIKHGFHQFLLSVSYKSEVIIDYFGDGTKYGVSIEYIYEEKRMGTAGALGLMRDHLTKDFFVMNGDLLTNVNFDHMFKFHQLGNSSATMGVREYDYQVPYGVVKVDDNQIIGIEEKPIQQFYVNGGVYVLHHKMLDLVPHDAYFDMPTLFEKAIEKKRKCVAYPIRQYWLDIGRLEEFEKANNEYSGVFL
ncbi:MAG: CBS domain-containing protein [Rhizobiales bacterium]|nr:CBS domain-containing protein [Hyphomicrobiales bacterium]